MKIRFLSFIVVLTVTSSWLQAQQTGVAVVTTPGSTARNVPKAIPVERPKATCNAPVVPEADRASILPDMLFSRDTLICVRHSDGRTEQLISNIPWGQGSATKTDVAFWLQEKHELHVFSIPERRDTTLDTIPGANRCDVVWSMNGRTLAYFPTGPNVSGIRVVDLSTGRHNRFALAAGFKSLITSPDPEYVLVIGLAGVERFRVRDGRHDTVLAARYADHAEYSSRANLLGLLSSTTSKFLNSPPEVASGSAATDDDDAPDCTGGTSNLILQNTATKQLSDVPFPAGFNTVLDFEFSPDERAVVVTFGVTGCDYPGDVARVYKVTVPDLRMTPLSPAGRVSVRAHWSPDGRTVIYSDYSGDSPNGGMPLLAIDLQSGRITKLTNSSEYGSDDWLGWR